MPSSRGKIGYFADLLLIFVFFGLMCLPFMVKITGIEREQANFENRKMKQFPKFPAMRLNGELKLFSELSEFLDGLIQFTNYNFPFRNELFRVYRGFRMELFLISPVPDIAVCGDNGWFFLGDGYGNCIKESKGLLVFPDHYLNQCVINICRRENELNLAGIKYYVAVAPGKATVYGQFLRIK